MHACTCTFTAAQPAGAHPEGADTVQCCLPRGDQASECPLCGEGGAAGGHSETLRQPPGQNTKTSEEASLKN